jgi:4-amino-4-deoxy-L-arabinose transferase-like glycosyltransferase
LFLKGAKDPEKGKRFFKAFFAVLGLAVMTKGCAGFILPLIIVVSYIVSGRKWKLLKALNIPAGALIVLAIGLPWYIVMYALHGDKYLSQPLLQEALGRLFHALRGETIRAFLTEYAKNILPSIGAFIAWFLPYSLFLPAAAADSFKSRKTYSLERDSYKLILSYFFGIFVFFMITAPREYQYFLPLAPALGLMAARYFINIEERREQFKSAAFAAAYMSAAAIYGLCLTGVLYAMHRIYPLKTPACDYAVVLAPLIIVLLYLRRKSAAATFALPAAMALAMLFLAGRAMPLLNDKALPAFAEEIKSRIAPGDRVGVGSVDISQRRLEFFLDIPVEDVNVKAKSPDAAAEHKKKIADFLEKEGRAYLVIAEDDYAALVRDELKQGLVLVSRGVMWKNRLKRSVTREAFLEVLRGEKDILEDVLRHRVYLLTNRK